MKRQTYVDEVITFIMTCIVNSLIRPVGERKALFILTGSNKMRSAEIIK